MKNIPPQLILILAICSLFAQRSFAQFGNDNPTGVTGEFNGSVTTAGSYDPYTGNAKRFVDDLAVTGSIGAYPLKWTRVLNTRAAQQWSHSYAWKLWVRPYRDYKYFPDQYDGPGGVLSYPDGRTLSFAVPREPYSYEASSNASGLDWLEHVGDGNFDVLLHDGGKVKFRHPAGSTRGDDLRATEIIDPYGQTTYLIRDSADRLWQVREPGGRYLQINYTTYSRVYDGDTVYWDVISSVQAYSAPGQLTETVTYEYVTSYYHRTTFTYLTRANYADGNYAQYTYEPLNPHDPIGSNSINLIKSCDDVRFAGPMKRIQYEYATHHDITEPIAVGQIKAEKNLTTGQTVSELIYPQGPFSQTAPDPRKYLRTERKGDGATREFQYRADPENPELESYTDFKNQRSYIGQEPGPLGKYVTNLIDARGHLTAIEKDAYSDAVERVTHPDGKTKRFTYTNHYYVASQTDERGNTTYHDRYDSGPHKNRIWRTRYPNGGEEQFTYNPFGQVETHTMLGGGVENFRYDGRGRKHLYWPPATESDPNPEQHPTQYFYYDSGPHTDRLRLVVDPRGNGTGYEYNLRGQVIKVQHQDWTYTQSEYNPDGTLAWTADENHPNASWNVSERTRYTYDEYKRVLTVTNPMGETTTTSYAIDPAWAHPLLHTTSSIKYVISPGGKNTVCDYDANFRKTHQVVALGTADEAWTLFDYDPVGNLIETTDARLKVTTFEYDERNRQKSVTNPLNETTRFEYDPAGNRKKEIRPDGTFRSWDYDTMNRLWKAYEWRTNDPPTLNQTTTYTRDHAGNATSIKDSKGAIYSFVFDALNRKTTETYPADASGTPRTETWKYDEAGNLILYKTPAGQYKNFWYDNRNRQRHSWWDGNVGQDVVTNYDLASRMTDITTNGGETVVRFYYDAANRKVWEEQTLAGQPTRWLGTGRDADGNRLHLWSGGYCILYDYNHRNQLTTIRDGAQSPIVGFTYDASGNMTQRRLAWFYSSPTNIQYDDLNRVTMMEHGVNGSMFARSHYQYDSNSREIATWRDEDGSKGDLFRYNAASQLTDASYKADWVWTGQVHNSPLNVGYTYTADQLNRSRMTVNGAVTNYTASGMNQYTSVTGQALAYDTNFNLKQLNGAIINYDADRRIKNVIVDGVEVASFTYDGLGRCVRRIENGVARIFTYDDWNPFLEWDNSGNQTAANIYGARADEILIRWDATYGFLFYKQDRRGNVVFLMDGNGGVIEKYSYDAFGKPKLFDWWGNERAETLYGNRFLFTGREWLKALKIYDYRNRMYHPDTGRFLQTDPIGFKAGDMNLFRYCGDDPVDRTDPTGLVDTSAIREYSTLTSWLGGDWIKGSDGLSALDWNDRNSIRPQAGMDNGDSGGDARGQRDMAGVAEKNEGSKKYHNTKNWRGKEVFHCNEFVADMAEASGRARPQVWVEGFPGGYWRDPVSNELADPNVKIPRWSEPRPLSEARRNDIIAQRHGKWGHTGIVTGPRNSISVNTDHGGVVEKGNWGFRPFPYNGEKKGDPPPVVRHYLPGGGSEW